MLLRGSNSSLQERLFGFPQGWYLERAFLGASSPSMYTSTSKLLGEGTHHLPAYTGSDGQSAEWSDPWNGQLPLPISLASQDFPNVKWTGFHLKLKKTDHQVNIQDLYWLNCNSNHWWEFIFSPNFQTPACLEGQLQKKNDHGITQDQPQDCMVPSVIHPRQWNGWEGSGQPHQRRQREEQGKNWQSLLFHSEWMELGHRWH